MAGGGGGSNQDNFSQATPANSAFFDFLAANTLNEFQNQQGTQLPQTQVGPNANVTAGFEGSLDFANTGGQAISNQAVGGFGDLLNTLDVANNPQVQNQITQANRQITEEFQRGILPAISVDAVAAGQFGGSRQGVAEGIAATGATNAIANSTSNILADAFRTGSENARFAVGNAANTFGIGNAPNQLQGQVGLNQGAFDQAALDDELASFFFDIQRPFDLLSMFQGLTQGNVGGTSATNFF